MTIRLSGFDPDALPGEANALLLALLDSASDALAVVNARGDIVLVNRRTEEMFAYRRVELVCQSVEVLIPAPLAKRHTIERARYVSNPVPRPMGPGLDLWARRSDGTQFPVEISLTPLETEQEVFAATWIRDVIDVAALAQRLMQLMAEVGNEIGAYLGRRRGPSDQAHASWRS